MYRSYTGASGVPRARTRPPSLIDWRPRGGPLRPQNSRRKIVFPIRFIQKRTRTCTYVQIYRKQNARELNRRFTCNHRRKRNLITLNTFYYPLNSKLLCESSTPIHIQSLLSSK